MALLLWLLLVEYIGDFIFQSREVAITKSTKFESLLIHIWTLFATLIFGLSIGTYLFDADHVIKIESASFVFYYCLTHGIQDWFIWRLYKVLVYRREKKRLYNILYHTKEDGMKIAKIVANFTLKDFQKNKMYAEDKLFYDIIGLDRLLHVCSLVFFYYLFLSE